MNFNTEIPNYGDLSTIEGWLGGVADGGFMPYDGCGNFSDGEMMTANYQDDVFGPIPDGVTHIVWFNK